MEEFCALRAKAYAYLINGYNDDDYDKGKILNKKPTGTKTCVIKRRLMFENYKGCLFNNNSYIKITRKVQKWLSWGVHRKSAK